MTPHEGHRASLPGRTLTGEKYITSTAFSPYCQGGAFYLVFSGAGVGHPKRSAPHGRQRWFPYTTAGFRRAIAYRDGMLLNERLGRKA